MDDHASQRHAARVEWTGNRGSGTSGYDSYGREYVVSVEGKPPLEGSAVAAYRGDARRHNPEELFVAAVASCHMLFLLSLAARSGVRVLTYADAASGELTLDADGGGRFGEIVLRPVVTVGSTRESERLAELHRRAHERCFIANSCSVPIRIEPGARLDGAAIATLLPNPR